MARHRHFQNMDYDEEYGYDDVYGRSLEDEVAVSPSTAAQFMYPREGRENPSLRGYFDQRDDSSKQKSPLATTSKAAPVQTIDLAPPPGFAPITRGGPTPIKTHEDCVGSSSLVSVFQQSISPSTGLISLAQIGCSAGTNPPKPSLSDLVRASATNRDESPVFRATSSPGASVFTPAPSSSLSQLAALHGGSGPQIQAGPSSIASYQPLRSVTDSLVHQPLPLSGVGSGRPTLAKLAQGQSTAMSRPRSVSLAELAQATLKNAKKSADSSLLSDLYKKSGLKDKLADDVADNDRRTEDLVRFQSADDENIRPLFKLLTQQNPNQDLVAFRERIHSQVISKLAKKYRNQVLFDFSSPSPDDLVKEKQQSAFHRKK